MLPFYIRLTRNRDSCGIKVMSSRQTAMAIIIGQIRLTMDSMGSPLMAAAMNRLEPKGGVQKPMARATVITTPKWMGSIPMEVTMGRKMGVKIKIAGVISINIPTTIRITFISRNTTYLLVEIDIIPALIAAGIPEYAITKDMAEEAEIKNKIMPLVHALLTKIFIKDFTVRLL